jgi:hypothetical protein
VKAFPGVTGFGWLVDDDCDAPENDVAVQVEEPDW